MMVLENSQGLKSWKCFINFTTASVENKLEKQLFSDNGVTAKGTTGAVPPPQRLITKGEYKRGLSLSNSDLPPKTCCWLAPDCRLYNTRYVAILVLVACTATSVR